MTRHSPRDDLIETSAARGRLRPMRLLLWIALLLCGGLSLRCACALDPSRDTHGYRRAQWTRRDGLPSSTLTALAQAPDGALWVGTDAGLVRFDGIAFSRADAPAPLRTGPIRALCEAKDGALWIGTRDGAYRMAGGRFSHIATAEGDRYRDVFALSCDTRGRVVAATAQGGLFQLSPSGARPFPGWPRRTMRTLPAALAADRDGALWVGTYGEGLFRCDKRCARVASKALPANANITALTSTRDGRLWIGRYDRGLYRRDPDGSIVRAFENAIAPGVIWRLYEDRNDSLWVANRDSGLYRIRNGAVCAIARVPDPTQALPLSPYALLEDRDGNLWVGSDGNGLHRLGDVNARSLGVADGLPAANVQAVLVDADDSLWIGTRGAGIAHLSAGRIDRYRLRGPFANAVTGIARARDGRLWFATRGGIHVRDADGRIRRDRATGAPVGLITGFLADRAGRLWAGGEPAGLSVRENGRWRTPRRIDGYDGGGARSFAEAPDGTIWIGTQNRGLYAYRDGRFVRHAITGHDIEPEIAAVQVDRTGVPWLSTDTGGLFRWDGDHARAVSTPLPGRVFSMIEDRQHTFWFCTSVGIVARSRQALLDAAEGADAPRILDAADGVPSSDCNRNAQPLIAEARNGALWFAMNDGVVAIDPAAHAEVRRAPVLTVERIVAHGRGASPASAAIRGGSGRIEIDYAAVDLTMPERLRYRYRLTGSDGRWIALGVRRRLEFFSLRPGRYVLELQAARLGEAWSGPVRRIAVDIPKTWWKTSAFKAALATTIALLAFAFYRYQMKIMRARHAVLDERNRIARELHDTIAQSYSGILVRLEIAKRLAAGDARIGAQLDTVEEIARDSLGQLRSAVAQIRPEMHAGLPLSTVLRQRAAQQLSGTRVELDVVSGCDGVRAAPEALHQLCRILEECISNALLHASPSRIVVRIWTAEATFRMRVEDDGPGFGGIAPEAGTDGNGIRGMRERARGLGGTLHVDRTAPGGCVALSIPLRTLGKRHE